MSQPVEIETTYLSKYGNVFAALFISLLHNPFLQKTLVIMTSPSEKKCAIAYPIIRGEVVYRRD